MPAAPTILLDREAISGILGSISIACWVIVFTPQLYENFKRKSAEGLSLTFVVLWLLGDIFNVIGAVLQHVLPTMIILAVYYTLADIILLLQFIFYHRKRNHVNAAHLNPATPLAYPIDEEEQAQDSYGAISQDASSTDQTEPAKKQSTALYNTTVVLMVVSSGIVGWLLSNHDSKDPKIPEKAPLEVNWTGQFFGYLCAILYLASRVPQILLNFKRKSCDGISFLFFLFACLGNLSYVGSIFAAGVDLQFLIINASWLAGSIGTLFLDFVIFIQFWVYNVD